MLTLVVMMGGAFIVLSAGTASATGPTVSVPWPPNPTDGQMVTVSGTGFPARIEDPSGLQIIECTDPGGTTENLPGTADAGCDATTVQSQIILTEASGDFSAQYMLFQLTVAMGSNIDCDAAHYCVLWVGVDFNNGFEKPGAFTFSAPFEVGAGPAETPESPVAIALPLAAAAVSGGGAFVVARRRRQSSVPG